MGNLALNHFTAVFGDLPLALAARLDAFGSEFTGFVLFANQLTGFGGAFAYRRFNRLTIGQLELALGGAAARRFACTRR